MSNYVNRLRDDSIIKISTIDEVRSESCAICYQNYLDRIANGNEIVKIDCGHDFY